VEKLEKWWRSIKRRRRNHKTLILLGVAALASFVGLGVLCVLILFVVQNREPPMDYGNFATVVLVSITVIGAVIYWLLVGIFALRWLKGQRTYKERLENNHTAMRAASPRLNEITVVSPTVSGQRSLISAISLSPSQFEQEVAWIFSKRFHLQAEVVGKSNDGGIDVKLYDAGASLVAIIQAKRYDENKTLNPGFLRELDSCKRRMGVPRAYLVTTARFSADVRQQAEEMHIDLVDGRLFHEWRQQAHAQPENRRLPNRGARNYLKR